MRFLVTGGAGFIGSAVIRHLINDKKYATANVDCLTYAANLQTLNAVSSSPLYEFHKLDIGNRDALKDLFRRFNPDAVLHLAAETHVDRSIDGPDIFLKTNVMGTYTLLQVAREYWQGLQAENKSRFRFHHVSTDEVFGDLGPNDAPFNELTRYAPSSPYSASKAASDHLVNAWHRTFGLPVVITNCSNNYGPFQFPEKLIPHVILSALSQSPIPVYGDGQNIRDWLHVEDHARALVLVAERGVIGETYTIGGGNQRKNIDVVESICSVLDKLRPLNPRDELRSYRELITFVSDRPGHDRRYAIDSDKISRDLGWMPEQSFDSGLRQTVTWYLENENWWRPLLGGDYTLTRLGEKA